MTWRRAGGWGVALIIVVLTTAWLGMLYLRRPDHNSVMRGWELAGKLGCFSCHGPLGRGGVANPGAEEGEIPAWDGGTLMMYVESEKEIAEWILYGGPKRLAAQGQHSGTHEAGEHEDEEEEHRKGEEHQVHMPAYRERISDQGLHDLVALVKTIGAYGRPEMTSQAREGLTTARRLGCFGCHRVGGLVGTPNPGAFKGYIPPWRGADFEDLVRSREELREWILDGRIERLESNALAHFFTRRQTVQMPAYRSWVNDAELEGLMSYVEWVSRSEGR